MSITSAAAKQFFERLIPDEEVKSFVLMANGDRSGDRAAYVLTRFNTDFDSQVKREQVLSKTVGYLEILHAPPPQLIKANAKALIDQATESDDLEILRQFFEVFNIAAEEVITFVNFLSDKGFLQGVYTEGFSNALQIGLSTRLQEAKNQVRPLVVAKSELATGDFKKFLEGPMQEVLQDLTSGSAAGG